MTAQEAPRLLWQMRFQMDVEVSLPSDRSRFQLRIFILTSRSAPDLSTECAQVHTWVFSAFHCPCRLGEYQSPHPLHSAPPSQRRHPGCLWSSALAPLGERLSRHQGFEA